MPRDLSMVERATVIVWLEDQLAQLKAEQVPAPVPAQPVQPAPVIGTHPGFASAKAEGKFYDWLRDNDMLGPVISGEEFRGCDSITRACAEAEWPISWTAYALATAYLETAHQMIPVEEAYWLSPAARQKYFTRMYDITGARPKKAEELGNLTPGDGARFPGRGYPQLTGRKNYLKAGTALGIDLVAQPERALEPGVAAAIMIRGMDEGWFTNRKLSDTLPRSGPASREQFRKSRPIINGTDRDDDVAGFAIDFQKALQAGGWRF